MQVLAADCTALTCGSPASLELVVRNPAPVLTGPVHGARIDTATIAATSDAPGGTVQFLIDGRPLTAPVPGPQAVAAIPTELVGNGAHQVQAVQCNAAGTRCEGARSGTQTITVERLRPAITAHDTVVSPNGDGRGDVLDVRYALDAPSQSVAIRFTDRSGRVVFQKRLASAAPAGNYRYRWNGKNAAGTVVRDGAYAIELDTVAGAGETQLGGRASGVTRVDRTKPALSSPSTTLPAVYPYRDGYQDSTTLGARISEPVTLLTVEVRSSAGRVVRTINAGRRSRPGLVAVTWNGRTNSGALAPAGSYSFRFVGRDAGWNIGRSASAKVTVSGKRLVRKVGRKVVKPLRSVIGSLSGECSQIVRDVRSWTDSLGYYSNYRCTGSDQASVAVGFHSFRVPSAIRHGTVRVDAYGGSGRRQSIGRIVYLDRYDEVSDYGRQLGATTTTYAGPTVRTGNFLDVNRDVAWAVGTDGGNWYDIRDFTVVWTYYVLQ